MENSLNKPKIDKQSVSRSKRTNVKNQIVDATNDLAALDKQIDNAVQQKKVNVMARRYELAYTKLYNELPSWKQKSFKTVTRKDDTLYNEFISSVIALAENENQEILLTA